ncbi:MAG: hypothetical protein M3R13_05965 [Armatimonadota bacterium]|nr:hypothetical protein [Armatimonadota bacterium]
MTNSPRRGVLAAVSLALAGAGAVLAGTVSGILPIVLGTATLVGAMWFYLAVVARGQRSGPMVPSANDVSTPSKLRVKPIVKLREEVVAMLASHKTNPVVSAMAFDTQNEVDSIVLRSMEILEAKRRLQKLAASVFPSRAAVKGLEDKFARTSDEAAKASVGQALDTRREELRILEELESESNRLDANLDEAEAALAELRTRLLKVVASSSEQQAAEEMDPLSGMTERLHRISSTMEESVEMVTTRIGDNEQSL